MTAFNSLTMVSAIKKYSMFFIISLFFNIKSVAQHNYVKLNNSTDIKLIISLPKENESKRFQEWQLNTEIINNSNQNIFISDIILTRATFNLEPYLSKVNESNYSYYVEEFNAKNNQWNFWSESELRNSIHSQGIIETNEPIHKIKPQKSFKEKDFFLLSLKPGKYRIQKLLGVKYREDAFVIIMSNKLEFTVLKF